jgi:uncharacterized membrane protein
MAFDELTDLVSPESGGAPRTGGVSAAGDITDADPIGSGELLDQGVVAESGQTEKAQSIPIHDVVADENAAFSATAAAQSRPLAQLVGELMSRYLRMPAPSLVVGCAMVAFAFVFGRAQILNHRGFGTYAFDTGIYDQAVWLMGRDLNPFMTVRGLAVHGHHLNPFMFLLVPISWFGGGAEAFLVLQTVVFAAGAWPVYLIARKLFSTPFKSNRPGPAVSVNVNVSVGVTAAPNGSTLGSAWLAACMAIAYLLSPVLEWINQAHWHPESFSATPFLWAWWFAINKRWRAYGVAIVVAMSTREEAALSVIMIGVVLLIENRRSLWSDVLVNRERRANLVPPLLTIAGGAAWFFVSTKLIIPAFNGGRPPYFFKSFFGSFGGSAGGIVKTAVTDPGLVVSTVTKPDRIRYLRDLGLPTLFTFIASPLHFLIMVPSLLSNLLTDNAYAREIKYQYAAVVVGPLWIATLQGVARIRNYRVWLRRLVGMVFVASLVSNINFSPSPLSKVSKVGATVWSKPSARSKVQERALLQVPADAGVSATYLMVPHLDRRHHIYDYPNPFVPAYWGNYDPVKPTPDPDPANVEWIVADRLTFLSEEERDLFDELTAPGGRFEIYFDQDDVVVAGPVRNR